MGIAGSGSSIKKGANIEMLAPAKLRPSVVVNVEPAAWNKWRDVTAAEAEGNVRPKGRIGQQMRFVAGRINRVDGHIVGENRVIGREGRSDQFVKSNTRPHQTLVEASNEPGGVAHVRAVQKGGLLHRSADLPEPREFSEVPHAAAELLFERKPTRCACASACQEANNRHDGQKSD